MRCSASLSGATVVRLIDPELHHLPVRGPHDRAVDRLISRVGHLRYEAEPNWSLRQPPREVFEQIVRPGLGSRGGIERRDACCRKDLIASRPLDPGAVHEDKGIVTEVSQRREALRQGLRVLNELERPGVLAEELLDRVGMGTRRRGMCHGRQKREKILTGAHDESVVGDRDDVGECATGQSKADRHPARGSPGVGIRDHGIACSIREPHGYGDRPSSQMGRLADRSCAPRGREGSGHDQPFGVHEAKAGMDAAVELHDDIGDLLRKALILGRERERGAHEHGEKQPGCYRFHIPSHLGMNGSAERERKNLYPGIEKLDLELSIHRSPPLM